MASKNLRELRMSTAMSSLTLNKTRSTLAPSLSESVTRVKKVGQVTKTHINEPNFQHHLLKYYVKLLHNFYNIFVGVIFSASSF